MTALNGGLQVPFLLTWTSTTSNLCIYLFTMSIY